MKTIRVKEEWQRAGVYYVRTQAMVLGFNLSLEGEFAVEPFCRTDISRYFVYDVGGYRAKVQLDL